MPFLSHSLAQSDAAIGARLRAVAAVYGIQLELPDRTAAALPALSEDSRTKIERADVVIGLLTRDTWLQQVAAELEYARTRAKPMIVLVERGLGAQLPAGIEVIEFSRDDPSMHEHRLLGAVQRIRTRQQRNEAFWIAGIALGLIGLGALVATATATE